MTLRALAHHLGVQGEQVAHGDRLLRGRGAGAGQEGYDDGEDSA